MARRIPAEKTQTTEDVVFVHGRSDDGKKLAVLRKRGDAVSAAVLTEATEGKPLHGELVRLRPRDGAPALFDVDVLHGASPDPETERARDVSAGPARVATTAYRDGWDSIWGERAKRAAADLN